MEHEDKLTARGVIQKLMAKFMVEQYISDRCSERLAALPDPDVATLLSNALHAAEHHKRIFASKLRADGAAVMATHLFGEAEVEHWMASDDQVIIDLFESMRPRIDQLWQFDTSDEDIVKEVERFLDINQKR